jgi:hypothetical protein
VPSRGRLLPNWLTAQRTRRRILGAEESRHGKMASRLAVRKERLLISGYGIDRLSMAVQP